MNQNYQKNNNHKSYLEIQLLVEDLGIFIFLQF